MHALTTHSTCQDVSRSAAPHSRTVARLSVALALLATFGACSGSTSTTPVAVCRTFVNMPYPAVSQFPLEITRPVVGDGAVFVSYQDALNSYHLGSRIVALRASDSTLLWSRADYAFIDTANLALAGDILLLGTRPVLTAVRASDGTQLWQLETGVSGEPEDMVVDQGVLYTTNDTEIYAVRIVDGQLLWKVRPPDEWMQPLNSPYYRHIRGPVVGDGAVYVGTISGPLMALRAADGALLWHSPVASATPVPGANTGQSLTSLDPLLEFHGVLYVNAGDVAKPPLLLLRASDGSVQGSFPLPPATPGSPAWYFFDPLPIGGALYMGVSQSVEQPGTGSATYYLETGDGRPIWQTPVTFTPTYSVAHDTGIVLMGVHNDLIAVQVPDGKERWHLPWQWWAGSTTGTGGRLYIGQAGFVDRCDASADRAPVVAVLDEADGSAIWVHTLLAPH